MAGLRLDLCMHLMENTRRWICILGIGEFSYCPRICILGLMAGCWFGPAATAAMAPGEGAARFAVRDEVYLQETGDVIPSLAPLTSICTFDHLVYAGSARGLLKLADGILSEVSPVNGPVQRLITAKGWAWALTAEGIYRGNRQAWEKLTNLVATDLVEFRGDLVVATASRLWRIQGEAWNPMGDECPFGIRKLVVQHDTLYVLGEGQLTSFADGEFGAPDYLGGKPEKAWDWGELPSRQTRDALALDNRLYLATDRGLALIRGMNLTHVGGDEGLCCEDAICLAAGFTNDLWIGTTRGAIRMVQDQFHYFAGPRWLPRNEVQAIAIDGLTVYLATSGGLGIVRYTPFTLQQKAAYYERHLDTWGHKRLGFVHKLEWDDALEQFVREISDNDGGYSEDYLAAESYRFAVTQDPAARREATNTFHAMRWLTAISGIPGFPARAVWVPGERGHKSMFGSGSYPAEWHPTSDGRFEWKGDTSSDEISAHFYGVPVFLDLAAQGTERDQGREFLGQIASHLVDHGWKLIDVDGKPTRWGRWDVDYFTRTVEGVAARGLNSLEALSFAKTAEILTGDQKFAEGYRALVQLGYPQYAIRQSVTFPPEIIAHFDDQLAFFVYGNLLRHEADPDLRATYLRGLERSWEIVRIERNPWFNFVYGALTGHECEVQAAVAHLREWPLDLRVHSYRNSHRADYRTPVQYSARKGGVRAFSPRETQPMRWDHWTMEPDGGSEGREVEHPAAWLAAYWLGRYAGLITAPDTVPQVAISESMLKPGLGAKAYEGPPRPEGF
jgi:hypothetical protein